MEQMSELLLDRYLSFSTAICNERVVSELPYNEALICNLLYRRAPQALTATDLCEATRMRKSQMARTLAEMEEKGLIVRRRSDADRRLVCIELSRDGAEPFFRQHAKTLAIVQAIAGRMTQEKLQTLSVLLGEAADAAREVLG